MTNNTKNKTKPETIESVVESELKRFCSLTIPETIPALTQTYLCIILSDIKRQFEELGNYFIEFINSERFKAFTVAYKPRSKYGSTLTKLVKHYGNLREAGDEFQSRSNHKVSEKRQLIKERVSAVNAAFPDDALESKVEQLRDIHYQKQCFEAARSYFENYCSIKKAAKSLNREFGTTRAHIRCAAKKWPGIKRCIKRGREAARDARMCAPKFRSCHLNITDRNMMVYQTYLRKGRDVEATANFLQKSVCTAHFHIRKVEYIIENYYL